MSVQPVFDLHDEACLHFVRDNMRPDLRFTALDFVELYRTVYESAPAGALDPVETVQDWVKKFLAAEYHVDAQNSLYLLYVQGVAVAGCIVQQGVLKALVSTLKGAGAYVMERAVNACGNPAAMLTCIAGLEPYYTEHGWQVLSREPNWSEGEPDILTMYQPDLCFDLNGLQVPRSIGVMYPPDALDGCPLDVLPLHVLVPELTNGNRTVVSWSMSHTFGVNILSTDGFRLYDGSHLTRVALRYMCSKSLLPSIAQKLAVPVLLSERPYLSEDGQSMVYTRRTKDGTERTVTQKVGRYLRSRCTELSDEEVKQLCAAAKEYGQRFQLKFTRDPLVIQDVYENGPSSCMARRYRLYKDGRRMHPNEIYVHPDNDLFLAYLESREGDFVARAWVSQDRSLCSTVYGKDDEYSGVSRRMLRVLRDKGYEEDPCELMYNQPLLRVVADCGNVVLGYVDGADTGIHDDGDTLWVGTGSVAGSYTKGISQGEQVHCENCYEQFPEDEAEFTVDDEIICADCARRYYELALVHGEWTTALVHGDHVTCLHGHPEVNYVSDDAWSNGNLECVWEVTAGASAGDLVYEDSALFHEGEVWVYDEAPEEVQNA